MTLWYGEAYERAFSTFNFLKVFDSVGSNLTADGSRDHVLHLQGLKDFSFTIEDANRDCVTGVFPTDYVEQDSNVQPEVATDDEAECFSEDSEAGANGGVVLQARTVAAAPVMKAPIRMLKLEIMRQRVVGKWSRNTNSNNKLN